MVMEGVAVILVCIGLLAFAPAAAGKVIKLAAKDTITSVLMNRGDVLEFALRNGEKRTMELLETGASVMRTNVKDFAKQQGDGGALCEFHCKVTIDGHEMNMQRYLPCQESFYEPYVVNGMRIWFDAVQDYFEPFTLTHGDCKPMTHASFAISDATDPVAPDMVMWYSNEDNFIDVANSYLGDDVWMGAYLGGAPHGGLDINMPKGTPLYAPIDFNYQWFFNAVSRWSNNNRWRGIYEWPNGSVWVLQAHHMTRLLVEEYTPLEKGTHYAEAAGVLSGAADHSHFVFLVDDVLMDPWYLFWQMFQDSKASKGLIHAQIAPVGPAKTGQPVSFRSDGSRSGPGIDDLSYYWTFGDGGWSSEANPVHTYAAPGIYPASLVVDDGEGRHRFTQHITIDGAESSVPVLSLTAPDEISFRERPAYVMDVYGCEVAHIPHTLNYVARQTRPKPDAKTINLMNIGDAELAPAAVEISYDKGSNWALVDHKGEANRQQLSVSVDATGLDDGIYTAIVNVVCPGASNSPQGFRISLEVRSEQPEDEVIIDDSDPGFYATPYFWVGSRFRRWVYGYKDFCLTNGSRAKVGEFVRFTPDLKAGEYTISFVPETPFQEKTRFQVRIHHANGDSIIWVEPTLSRTIGKFSFAEGMDGFVQILAEGAKGEILADAIKFARIGPAKLP